MRGRRRAMGSEQLWDEEWNCFLNRISEIFHVFSEAQLWSIFLFLHLILTLLFFEVNVGNLILLAIKHIYYESVDVEKKERRKKRAQIKVFKYLVSASTARETSERFSFFSSSFSPKAIFSGLVPPNDRADMVIEWVIGNRRSDVWCKRAEELDEL